MNNRYRIKVEERQNGEVSYIPQVGHPKLTTSVYTYLFTEWYNILDVKEHSKTEVVPHFLEVTAKQVIEDYKNNLLEEEGRGVKSVRYIDLD